jgi:hypothetical protein
VALALEVHPYPADRTPSPGRQPGHSRRRPRPTLLTLDQEAGELLLNFERNLEPRMAADRGDLAHLAGWAAKLAGATCRLAGLLHLASHLRDGWARPITADTFAAAVRLADYLVEHARAVFDLMGADPRTDDARWLLDSINRTDRSQFSRRDAHQAARGRFPKATDLEPVLRLLEEHSYLRRVDPEPSRDPHGRGRPASPRFLVNPLPRATETTQTTNPRRTRFRGFCGFCGASQESSMRDARLAMTEPGGTATAASSTLNRLSRYPGHQRRRGRPAALAGVADDPRPAAGGRGPAWRPRLPPHLRDLAGGRRHPRPSIDEVMGHEATGRGGQQRGSAMGAHYRHTTPEMAARIATAIEQRLTVVLEVAVQALEAHPNCSTQRVF